MTVSYLSIVLSSIWTPYFQDCLSFDKRYVAKMQNCHAKCHYFQIQYIIADFKCVSSIVAYSQDIAYIDNKLDFFQTNVTKTIIVENCVISRCTFLAHMHLNVVSFISKFHTMKIQLVLILVNYIISLQILSIQEI